MRPKLAIGFWTLLFSYGPMVVTGWAHPGHGPHPDGHSALHFLTSPLHWLELILAIAIAILVARSLRGQLAQRPDTDRQV